MPLDLSEVALDPSLGVNFCIIRNPGQFGAGGWIPGPQCQIQAFGIICIADAEALRMIPEGDRVEGSIQIITTWPIHRTTEAGGKTSDTVIYFGNQYRVMSVEPWRLNNYYSAILVRMTGS